MSNKNSNWKNKGGASVKTNVTGAFLRVLLAITLVLGLMPSLATTNAFANDAKSTTKTELSASTQAGEATLAEENMKVRFDTAGGTPATIDSEAVWSDEDYTWYLSSPAEKITKEGFTLTGWTAKDFNGDSHNFDASFEDEDLGNYEVDEATGYLVFTAVWKQDEPADTKTAFATLCTDGSLNFYYREAEVPAVGDTFDGKTVSAVYTDFVGTVYSTSSSTAAPWWADKSDITSVNVVDAGVPMPSGAAFYGLLNITELDMSSFDATKATEVTKMFSGCSQLRELNISNFDTSKWTAPTGTSAASGTNTALFSGCSCLAKITVGANYGWKMGPYSAASPGYGNLPAITAGIYKNKNEDFKGKYLTGKWTDGTNTYDSINDVPLSTAGTYSWDVDESQSQLYVKFDANGGFFQSGSTFTASEDVYVTSGQAATPPAKDLVNTGYETDGKWYKNAACTEEWNIADPVTEGMTLYVKWTEKTIPANWEEGDFTYNEENTQITGLTENGKIRIKKGQELDLTAAKSTVTGIADSSDTYGPFAFKEGENTTDVFAPTSVKFSDTITYLGKKAFYYYAGSSIDLPEGIQTIGESALASSQLTSVKIPSTVETMATKAFYSCKSLASVEFATGEDGKTKCAEIPTYAFASAPLTSLKLAEGLTTINDAAFFGANDYLVEAWLPSTVTTVTTKAFNSSAKTNKTSLYVTTQEQLDNNKGIVTAGNGHTVSVATKCVVTFDANGGTFADGSTTKTVDVKQGNTVAKIAEDPTFAGHDFWWWSKNQQDDPSNKQEFDFDNTQINEDTKIYAQWYEWGTYVVQFDLNGHGTTAPEAQVLTMKLTDEHVYATKPATDPTSTDGYSFCCWNLKSPDGTLEKWDFDDHDNYYVDDDSILGDNNTLTLYAKWYATTQKLSYGNVDGATNTNPTEFTVETDDITLTPAVKEGKTFIGWFEKDGRQTGDWGNQITKIAKGTVGDKTIYAKWEGDDGYTVTFNTNGGSSVASQTVISGKTAKKPADPTKAGYAFSGWYSDQNLTKAFNFSTAIKANTTLYAKWTAITTASSDSLGNAYVVDPTSSKVLRVKLVDTTKSALSGATVSIDVKGAVTIKLPASALSADSSKRGVTVTITYDDGTVVKNKAVTVKRSDGTALGSGKTDDKGQYTITFDEDLTRIKMYRLYNKWTGEHFYTANADEQKGLVKIGWNDEGTGWYAPTKTSVPVYRLYNSYVEGGDHHYTMDEKERDACVEAGWSYEGVAWYSCETTDEDSKPLYRQYNPNEATGTHNYTLSEDEAKKVVAAGWRDEGTAWRGYDSEK